MKLKAIATCAALGLTLCVSTLQAQDSIKPTPRLTIGGYGEAVYTRNFYSDNMFRYSHAERYKDAKGHGRVDLPHVVVNLGYDFGKGWSMGTEIEFEHGNPQSDARRSVEKFRLLDKKDRDAVVKFIDAI